MSATIFPAIWFDKDADQAFESYTQYFTNSEITGKNPIVVSATLKSVPIIGINGGPYFQPNPSISFMVVCEQTTEIDELWTSLSEGSQTLMPLATYPWSPYYGWIIDQNNVSWQLYQGKLDDVNNQALVPTLMFCAAQQGKCKQAIAFYQSVFKDFKHQGEQLYPEGDVAGQIMHAQFIINGFTVMAMDSGVPQSFTFNEGISLVISCENQREIDYYWDALTTSGTESRCGWCKDPFGVSWQVVPKDIDKLLADSPHAREKLLTMTKINIAELKNNS